VALLGAGVVLVNPGIACSPDSVLELLRTGVTGLRNVQLLKWLQEYGVGVDYNILIGFPGETVADYEELMRVMSAIPHLPPPNGKTTRVRVDRFSPFFDDSEALGIRGLRAAEYYRYLIPPDRAAPESYAYFFDHDLDYMEPLKSVIAEADDLISRWKKRDAHKRARVGAGFVEVVTYVDGRSNRHVLRDLDAALFVAGDSVSAIPALERQLGVGTSDLRAAISGLIEAGLMLQVGNSVVSIVPYAEPHTEEYLERWLRAHWDVGPRVLSVVAS
jgi:hypothetical protein